MHDRVTTTVQNAAQKTSNETSRRVISAVSARIAPANLASVSSPATAIAAGDEDTRNAVWLEAFGNRSKEGALKNQSGYTSSTDGAVIGIDTKIHDSLTVGIAGIHAVSQVKMKDQKSGDKIDAKSWLVSLYSMYEINDNWFTKAMVVLGKTDLTTKEKKPSNNVYTIATSNYSTTLYGVDASIGYKKLVSSNFTLTPELGINASHYYDKAHIEKGAGTYNKTYGKGSGASYSGYLGLSAAASLEFDNATIVPMAHVKITKEFANKTPRVASAFVGEEMIVTASAKNKKKTLVNTGLDVTMSRNALDFAVGYDIGLAKKYTSHTGTVKLRINL